MPEQHTLGFRVFLDQRFDQQTNIEPRPLPWHVNNVVTVNLAAKSLLIHGCCDCNDGIGMQMVNMAVRNESV